MRPWRSSTRRFSWMPFPTITRSALIANSNLRISLVRPCTLQKSVRNLCADGKYRSYARCSDCVQVGSRVPSGSLQKRVRTGVSFEASSHVVSSLISVHLLQIRTTQCQQLSFRVRGLVRLMLIPQSLCIRARRVWNGSEILRRGAGHQTYKPTQNVAQKSPGWIRRKRFQLGLNGNTPHSLNIVLQPGEARMIPEDLVTRRFNDSTKGIKLHKYIHFRSPYRTCAVIGSGSMGLMSWRELLSPCGDSASLRCNSACALCMSAYVSPADPIAQVGECYTGSPSFGCTECNRFRIIRIASNIYFLQKHFLDRNCKYDRKADICRWNNVSYWMSKKSSSYLLSKNRSQWDFINILCRQQETYVISCAPPKNRRILSISVSPELWGTRFDRSSHYRHREWGHQPLDACEETNRRVET